MGAWSHEPFGNDIANDWAYQLVEVRDWSVVEAAFDAVLESTEYIESDQGSEAVAAAEVLAKALGRGTQSDAYTEKVEEWLKLMATAPSGELCGKAKAALERILGEDSELNELWVESGEPDPWRDGVSALIAAMGN